MYFVFVKIPANTHLIIIVYTGGGVSFYASLQPRAYCVSKFIRLNKSEKEVRFGKYLYTQVLLQVG